MYFFILAHSWLKCRFSYIHASILFQIHFPFRLLQNIDKHSLCYTSPCWLSILNTAVYTCPFQTPSLSFRPNPNHRLTFLKHLQHPQSKQTAHLTIQSNKQFKHWYNIHAPNNSNRKSTSHLKHFVLLTYASTPQIHIITVKTMNILILKSTLNNSNFDKYKHISYICEI